MKTSSVRIAVVDDDPLVSRLVGRVLVTAGYEPKIFSSGDEFLETGGPSAFDVVLTDLQMEGASGLDVLKTCRGGADPPEVLLMTGHGTIRSAVESMRLGALDYLAKPVEPEELLHRVAQAIEARRLRRQVDALSGEVRRRSGVSPVVSESKAMREFLARAGRAAESSSTVLILGETGTGKEVLARHIQATGPRADRTYLTVNCAALPETLLESELFGHARGAFSGAHALKRGLFEEADGGTLFLDEIGSTSPAAQAKLLRVVEEGAVRRVGEIQPIPVNVRILAATNRDLPRAIAAGEFREDLYYRLSVLTLVVPPLRERQDDIEPLARGFLAESVRRLGKFRVFASETVEFLKDYSYPGNVRELRYAVEQAVVLSEDGILRPSDFAFRSVPAGSGRGLAGAPGAALRAAPREITPERIRTALAENGGNRVRAARALGISRATFYRLLGKRSAPVEEGSG
ncbi:MAG: sigma-54 dependent transcriptional regulator [Acidobacteriota bacterium]|nr:sigma-54 dependent transcriptional regulator [Acidobacteriota bacterium]